MLSVIISKLSSCGQYREMNSRNVWLFLSSTPKCLGVSAYQNCRAVANNTQSNKTTGKVVDHIDLTYSLSHDFLCLRPSIAILQRQRGVWCEPAETTLRVNIYSGTPESSIPTTGIFWPTTGISQIFLTRASDPSDDYRSI